MDIHFPDIALKQPKADPRTVILNKWHFLESSSDHMPEYYKQPYTTRSAAPTKTATTSKSFKLLSTSPAATICDKLMCDTSAFTSRLESQKSVLLSSTTTSTSNCFADAPLAAASVCFNETPSSLNSSLHSNTTLVNNSQSCHLTKITVLLSRFVDSLKNLYKFQKTKFFLVLIFFYCAISLTSLPITQAIPVRYTTASGQRLILHSNTYRERYQPDQRQQHKQHTQNYYQQHPQQQQQQQTRQQKSYRHQQRPFQRTSSYIAPILRRAQIHYRQQQQQQLQHRHHLHQRAAPVANLKKMSYCENNKFFKNLSLQVNATLSYIKTVCNKYLQEREGKSYEEMKEMWKLLELQIHNPNHKTKTFDNPLHQKMHDFYMHLQNFQHLAEFANKDTTENKSTIEHGEEIKISVILTLFNELKQETIFIMNETEKVLNSLAIEKPNVHPNDVEFNRTILSKVRDFLIVKEFIEEVEQIAEIINGVCETNESG